MTESRWFKSSVYICGGLATIVGLWVTLGFPIPATSMDIKRLDQSQTEIAIDVYQNKLNNLILLAPNLENMPASKIWNEEISRTKRQLEAAEQRKIELNK